MKRLIIATVVASTIAPAAWAGPIEQACLRSGREAANRSLCGCIQQVADMTLTNSDQRQAAKFFHDPHRAQEIRQSDRASHEAFWQRYKNFGATAEAFCAG
ncbi:hypothetical protein [Ostreiculturibacter nitratireducens]|uniref:hypothetical protein n=1 Tax=Ostreiculturibacter nitratireducens TaxID=3075226 RepID=UPI0031B64C5B